MNNTTNNTVPLVHSRSLPAAGLQADNVHHASFLGRSLDKHKTAGTERPVSEQGSSQLTDIHQRQTKERYPEGFMELGKNRKQKAMTCLHIMFDSFKGGIKKGAIIGAIAGGITGVILGASAAGASGPGAIAMAITGAIGGVVGAGIGAGAGAIIGGTLNMCRSAVYLVIGQEYRVKVNLRTTNNKLAKIDRKRMSGRIKNKDLMKYEALVEEKKRLQYKLEDIKTAKATRLKAQAKEAVAKAAKAA